jgi:glycerol-3-phosphate dehydrogenase
MRQVSPRREDILREVSDTACIWDVLVIGGGATGLGAAVESASRSYRTLLIERDDFAKGTSSRSTKLVHGGVRYLGQFNITLVLDALRERGYMLRNAPHLVHELSFVVPAYSYSSLPYYGLGLQLYERLSGSLSFGKSELLSSKATQELLPTLSRNGLKGGILYRDGQFDDARYAIALMRTLQDLGGTAINYLGAVRLLKRHGKTTGVVAKDHESGEEVEIQAKVVVNATGVFADEVRRMDEESNAPVLTVSQGTHFVLPREFLPGKQALMIPKTADGRVLFAIPWYGRIVVGTTDEPVPSTSVEPRSLAVERKFLATHIEHYMGKKLQAGDVLSMWSGLRPLVKQGRGIKTSKLSRDHTILISNSGLVTVTGGKWTTYRKMGEDTITQAAKVAGLAAAPSRTVNLKLHGWTDRTNTNAAESDLVYGSDLPAVEALGAEDYEVNALLHPRLPYRRREIVWAARSEMARTVEDALARRTRALFLDVRAAMESAPMAAQLMARELHRDEAWVAKNVAEFEKTASGYIFQGL